MKKLDELKESKEKLRISISELIHGYIDEYGDCKIEIYCDTQFIQPTGFSEKRIVSVNVKVNIEY
jgi:hypothetical protein